MRQRLHNRSSASASMKESEWAGIVHTVCPTVRYLAKTSAWTDKVVSRAVYIHPAGKGVRNRAYIYASHG